MDSESLPSVETLPSLRAGIAKSGDILYTPPGMIIIDKVVNEDSICVWQPEVCCSPPTKVDSDVFAI